MNIDISHITIPAEFDSLSDIYLPVEDLTSGVIYPGPRSIAELPDYLDVLQFILKECKKIDKVDFSLHLYHEKRKIIFRVHVIESLDGKIYDLRKLSTKIPDIKQLGYRDNYTELLLSEKLNNGGLIIMCGETGQGKSTTAAASICYRLKKYGSFCLTIEDPVEIPLQGFYPGENGKTGVCYQTQVSEEGIEEAIKGALRSYPSVSNSILFLGEIRSSAMANEVLKIAANGHLVFSTMHGFDLISSIERFVQMASSHKNTKKEEVISMFSLVFRLAIHQKLIRQSNGTRKVDPKVIFSSSPVSNVANRIKTGNVQLLATDIEQQNMMLKQGRSILQM